MSMTEQWEKNPSITNHVVRASDSIRVSAPAPQQLLETSVLFPHLAPLSGETTIDNTTTITAKVEQK